MRSQRSTLAALTMWGVVAILGVAACGSGTTTTTQMVCVIPDLDPDDLGELDAVDDDFCDDLESGAYYVDADNERIDYELEQGDVYVFGNHYGGKKSTTKKSSQTTKPSTRTTTRKPSPRTTSSSRRSTTR